MTKVLWFYIIFIMILSQQVYCQNNTLVDSLSVYGKFSVHGAVFDSKVELQENSPKVGAKVHRKITSEFEVFGGLEYRYHIINGTEFNNDASTPADFINDPFKEIEAFVSRLAFVGFSHDKYGTLSVGKQWGVYYDIASYTDNFTVFGGSSTGVYAGGTDGGWKGTGRADKSIVYRNTLGDFELGGQTQLVGDYINFGLALQYKYKDLKFGFGWNRAEIQDEFKPFIEDIGEATTNVIGGIQYNTDKWTIGAAIAFNDDEFIRLTDDEVISFPTNGYELFASYKPSAKLEIQGGLNYMGDDGDNPHYEGEYQLLHWIGGVNYYLDKNTFFYTSFRIDNSKSATGATTHNVFLVGFTYNFNKIFK